MKRHIAFFLAFSGLVLIFPTPRALGQEATEELLQRLRQSLHMLQLRLQSPDTVLYMPVQGVTVKEVKDTWHAPRGGRIHEGQDFLAKRGTPIFSATPGIVLQIGRDGIGGNSIFVFAAGGRAYYYAHLDSFAPGLKTGMEVGTSTLLGYVGDTGNAKGTPPHLHFGLYTATTTLNPLPLLVDR
jgi:peptidoglycan LD-endopeptidase LytH